MLLYKHRSGSSTIDDTTSQSRHLESDSATPVASLVETCTAEVSPHAATSNDSPTTLAPGDPARYIGGSISDTMKTQLLNEKWKPPAGFSFPVTNGRKYNVCWEHQFKWLRYSESKDKAFCAYCILFGNKPNRRGMHSAENFSVSGFSQWKNATGTKRGALLTHEKSQVHMYAASRASAFRDVITGRSNDIESSLSKAFEEQVARNKSILLSIIDVVILLGRRNVPFRGREWNKITKRENGNFDFFLNWKSKFDPLLKDHLNHAPNNAKYMSPKNTE